MLPPLLLLLLVVSSAAAAIVSTPLQLGDKLACGQYGAVHEATYKGRRAIAKRAAGESAEFACAYLSVEREVNEAVAQSPAATRQHFAPFIGQIFTTDGGKTPWLVWERLPGAAAPTLELYAGAAPKLEADFGLSLTDVLRALLRCCAALHGLGYVHRDVKPANVLLDAAAPADASPLRLIDLGSAAMADGCTVLDAVMGKCTAVDANRSPCTPDYAPPEQFVLPEHPWAFDVFAVGVVYLRTALRCLRTDEQLKTFRHQLAACDGDLSAWVRSKLQATALDAELVADLTRAFPPSAPEALPLLSAMLRTDAAARPSIDALLAHPYCQPATEEAMSAEEAADATTAAALGTQPPWLPQLLADDGCAISFYETSARPLTVKVRLAPPLGLLLGEPEGSGPEGGGGRESGSGGEDGGGAGGVGGGAALGLTVDDVLAGGAAAASGKVFVGDTLVSIGGTSVRGAGLEQVGELLATSAPRGKAVELSFERPCTADGCEVVGTDLDGSGGGDDSSGGAGGSGDSSVLLGGDGAAALADSRLGVVDAGVADAIGQRTRMEDTHVLTSFSASPLAAAGGAGGTVATSYLLAAAFDGHRGPLAAQFGAAELPAAVRRAVERAEPSPLAAAWREVSSAYLLTGAQDGTCVSAALVADKGDAPSAIEIINCGDCRAVLGALAGDDTDDDNGGDGGDLGGGSDGGRGACVVEFATKDHCASDALEGARIGKMGGTVGCQNGSGELRVAVESASGTWHVAVARALGGTDWRNGGISDVADYARVSVRPRHRFVLLASDGVVSALEDGSKDASADRSEPLAWRVAAAQAAGVRAADIARGLVTCAAREGSTDNMTCLVLLLGETAP